MVSNKNKKSNEEDSNKDSASSKSKASNQQPNPQSCPPCPTEQFPPCGQIRKSQIASKRQKELEDSTRCKCPPTSCSRQPPPPPPSPPPPRPLRKMRPASRCGSASRTPPPRRSSYSSPRNSFTAPPPRCPPAPCSAVSTPPPHCPVAQCPPAPCSPPLCPRRSYTDSIAPVPVVYAPPPPPPEVIYSAPPPRSHSSLMVYSAPSPPPTYYQEETMCTCSNVIGGEADVDAEWEAFKAEFEKAYSQSEDETRRRIFIKSVRARDKLNAKLRVRLFGCEAVLNELADLTPEERRAVLGENKRCTC